MSQSWCFHEDDSVELGFLDQVALFWLRLVHISETNNCNKFFVRKNKYF